MDFKGALRARLLAATPVTAIVGQRVYWENRPQNAPFPAIVLSYVFEPRDQHMGGFQPLQRRVLQIDVYAVDTPTVGGVAQKEAIKEAVITALEQPETSNGIRFCGAVDVDAVPRNERTETQFVYRDAISATIFFTSDTA